MINGSPKPDLVEVLRMNGFRFRFEDFESTVIRARHPEDAMKFFTVRMPVRGGGLFPTTKRVEVSPEVAFEVGQLLGRFKINADITTLSKAILWMASNE